MQNSKQNPGSAKSGPIQFADTDDLLDIRYDNIFKAVFTRETPASQGALSALISALIDRKITVEAIAANEPAVEDTRERNIRFDISCRAESGELINIEMCFNPKPGQNERLEYYAAKLHTSQGLRGIDKDYSDLKESYQIALVDKKRLFNDNILIHTFRYYDPVRSVPLGGKISIIVVELLKAESIVDKDPSMLEPREAWAVFFQYLTDRGKRVKINEILKKEEGIAMAGETLITITDDERERLRLMSEEKYILDKQSDEVYARRKGRAEGLAEGREEGLQEGRAEGREEGLQEGRAEGRAEERQRFLELLDSGLSVEEIKQRLSTSKD